jgi:hypothetical protein
MPKQGARATCMFPRDPEALEAPSTETLAREEGKWRPSWRQVEGARILTCWCCLSFSGRWSEALAHQAGSGGEVVVYGGSRSSGSCRGKVRELWTFRLSTASSLRRQRHAAAIPGEMGGHTVLGANSA